MWTTKIGPSICRQLVGMGVQLTFWYLDQLVGRGAQDIFLLSSHQLPNNDP